MKIKKTTFVLMCVVFIGLLVLTSMLVFAQGKKNDFLAPSSIPQEIVENIENNYNEFLQDLNKVIFENHDNLLLLVDKNNFLSSNYEPDDLIYLKEKASYLRNRENLQLRVPAEKALEKMAYAALQDGVTLVASSTYRSYDYQKEVYERHVNKLGKEQADRESARPGTSQHQLGTVVDFGSITDEFATTKAGIWLDQNASKFGWSLSFPQGYEAVTGYKWECWHYRFVGESATELQRKWFNDIQQYMLEYINSWKRYCNLIN